jgi:polyphosphate kinase
MSKSDRFDDPQYYLNRELSWLEFNQRVLYEGMNPGLPAAERLKFLAIVGSNLDEFFMVRVAALMQQRSAGIKSKDPAGLTPIQQLNLIQERTREMVSQQTEAINQILSDLKNSDVQILSRHDYSSSQHQYLQTYFAQEMLPVLTPMALPDPDSAPLIPALQLNIILRISHPSDPSGEPSIVVIPVPGQFLRFIPVPGGPLPTLTPVEEVVASQAAQLFPHRTILADSVFRITRDADVEIQEDEAGDLLSQIEQAVISRRRRKPVQLEIPSETDPFLKKWLMAFWSLTDQEVYEIRGWLQSRRWFELVRHPAMQKCRLEDWTPKPSPHLSGIDEIWDSIRQQDILLFHPYESFEPVIQLLNTAADDPQTLAIKQTLYRTAGNSTIVRALARAARNGKEVTVLVELKARFDEATNINWARHLEDAGCHVIYGVARLKTHAKALVIVRRDEGRIRRYVHLATGNYNEDTVKIYSDLGLLTCDDEIAADVGSFFNLLTGQTDAIHCSHLSIAPNDLRNRFIHLIEREIQTSSPDQPGWIIAKVNSLQDPGICQALYRASMAGVKIQLNVRGICCLRPGIPGISETIEVRSIVGRFLEHARIFSFRNGGHEEVYLSSADWMRRNLDRRLELLFPIRNTVLRKQIQDYLKIWFSDDVNAWRLRSDGTYEKIKTGSKAMCAQKIFCDKARDAARMIKQSIPQFRPMKRPDY